MHVRFMQKVDYYAGIPLCFLVTLFENVKRLLSHPNEQFQIKKILFIELSEMGSAILAYPALKRAVDSVGRENVYFLIFSVNRESVEVLGIIPDENIITINSANIFTFKISAIKALLKLRRLKISASLDLELFSRCTALFSYFSGAKLRAGFHNYTEEGLYRGNLLTHKVYYNSGLHMSESFLALIGSLTENENDQPLLKKKIKSGDFPLPKYVPAEVDLERIKDVFKNCGYPLEGSKLFVLNPDPGLLHLRGWPKENYALLAKHILEKDPNNYVGIVGLKHSKKYYDFIKNYCESDKICDFTGETANLKELLALLTFASCLITNDSGPAHMAALTKTKSIVLFGPETPLRYKPLGDKTISLFAGLACSPCFSAANHRHSVCTNNICMREIKVEEVYEKILV
jgi:ADP-heptose:LPS heptosyltransferase